MRRLDFSEIKQYVVDFVEGRVEARDFMLRFQNDPNLPAWFQKNAPEGKVSYMSVPDESTWGVYSNIAVPYDIYLQIGESVHKPESISAQFEVHCQVSKFVLEVFPNEGIQQSNKFRQRFHFLLDNCPSSVGGKEADFYVEKILNEIPEDLPKRIRAQLFRERIKKAFHIEGKRHPRWLQPPEWPFNNGKPMRFASQASKGEMRFYLFEDVETGEERVVIQSY